MTIYKKDLQALNKEIKALERKMEKLIKEFDKGRKAKVTKKVTAKPVRQKPPRTLQQKNHLQKRDPQN
jgi:hypothetical protein